MVCQIWLFQGILKHSTLNVVKWKVVTEQVSFSIALIYGELAQHHFKRKIHMMQPVFPAHIHSDMRLMLRCEVWTHFDSPFFLCSLRVAMIMAGSTEMMTWLPRSCPLCSPPTVTHHGSPVRKSHGSRFCLLGTIHMELYTGLKLHNLCLSSSLETVSST